MHAALLAKLRQHDELCALLLSTGDAKLVEHADNDDYWGDGGDGRGRNMPGQLLVRVRKTLATEG
jgi:ribA/ribD-fused uncharacterized protein